MIIGAIRRFAAVLAVLALFGIVGPPAHAAVKDPVQVATPLSATVSDTYWQINWHWPAGPVIDPPTVVTVSGGTGPFTYSWQRISGDHTAYATSPTSNATRFNNYIPVGDWEPRESYFRCLITDTATGNMVYSPTVYVWIHVWGYSPPGDPPDGVN
jgi:hypothetical protein